MKLLGVVFVLVGIVALIFFYISNMRENNRLRSPIPDEEGIKVIFITPTK